VFYLLLDSLTHSRSWALLEKLPIVQPLKNFLAFHGTRRFITAFTRALHWSLSWARSIHFIPSYLSKIHFNIVHPPTAWPSQWSLSFWISDQYPICIPRLPHLCYMPCPSLSFTTSLTNSVELLPSWEVQWLSYSRILEHFYGTRRYVTIFTRARYWSKSNQSTPPRSIYLRSILILPSHLCLDLPSGLLPSVLPIKTLCTFVYTPCVLRSLSISLSLIWSF
jgi:hypothetical protein